MTTLSGDNPSASEHSAVAPVMSHLTGDDEHDQQRALVWRLPAHVGISSAAVGGGLGRLHWVVNIGVTRQYQRTDLATHASEVAQQLGLDGPGSALLTAADLSRHQGSEDGEVRCDATVGISKPTWAAATNDAFTRWAPGTINIVVQLPVALEAGAAVNAVATATEAKSQALFEAAIPGTGTASDAIVVCWPHATPTERFAGPRSVWGARIAREVHAAVAAGIEAAAQ